MSENSIVDIAALKVFSGNDPDLMKLHISTFLEFGPAQIEKLQSCLAEQNWSDLKNTAHKLKPKLSYMGMKSLVPDIQLIEDNAASEKELDKMEELVTRVVHRCNLAFDELRQLS